MSEEQEKQGFVAAVKQFDAAALNFVDSIYGGLMKDGAIGAFMRQGLNELATAFGTMMPESISVTEPGSIGHPLHSDIADAKEAYQSMSQESPGSALPSPSEIGREAKSAGSVHSEAELGNLPSPSEIGREQRPETQPDQGRDHSREM